MDGYPLTTVDGDLTPDTRAESIRVAILAALLTRPGERVMRPDFGADLRLFQSPAIVPLLAEARRSVTEAIADYPEVTFTLSAAWLDSGTLEIQCDYTDGQTLYTLTVT